jgi:ABC-type lipoprotein release transport system permease subunit
MHVAVGAGVAVATAVLTGALVVGDSLRVSLERLTAERLGRIDLALIAPGTVTAGLAERLAADPEFAARWDEVVPLLMLPGSAVHGAGPGRAGGVTILGVDGRFGALFPEGPGRLDRALLERGAGEPLPPVVLNEALARELGAAAGDPVLLYFEAGSAVPRTTLLGERDADDRVEGLRLTVAAVIPDRGAGRFTLAPHQAAPRNAFVDLALLQRETRPSTVQDAPPHVNALLAAGAGATEDPMPADLALRRRLMLDDVGLQLRRVDARDGTWLSVESRELVLRPSLAEAALEAAGDLGYPAMPVLSYLANAMRVGAREVPYSAVAALPTPVPAGGGTLVLAARSAPPPVSTPLPDGASGPAPVSGGPAPALGEDEVLLDEWTAEDLGAAAGDALEMEYFVVGPGDALETARHRFRVAGVVAMDGLAVDPTLTPEVPGLAGAADIAAWDPPFPVDLDRVRPRDEDYWDRWRAAPKAFVALETGQALWASRFGDLTSVRVAAFGPGGAAPSGEAGGAVPADDPHETVSADHPAPRFAREILARVDPQALGLSFEPVKARGLAGAAGATGFPGLFLGFSTFLIAAAALLVGLLFALGIELRARELGLLLAVGYPLAKVRRRLLTEALAVALAGGLAGLALAAGYAKLLLALLGRWWAPLVEGPLLGVALRPASLALGLGGSLLLVLAVVRLTLRRLAKVPARALLAGAIEREAAQEPVGTEVRRFATPERDAAESAPARARDAASRHREAEAPPPGARGRKPGRAAAPGRKPRRLLAGSLAAAAALLIAALATEGGGSSPALFFALGAVLLSAGCAGFALWTRHPLAGLERAALNWGGAIVARLAAGNSARHRGRSLLAVVLVACASFVLVAVAANRRPGAPETGKESGTGGFALVAESSAPLFEDLDDPEARRDLSFAGDEEAALEAARVFPLRLRPGDDASCLNLYQPGEPRLLGVPPAFVGRGGFSFAGAVEERENPWELLALDLGAGVVPAIGDAESVRWILHLALGDDLTVTDDHGRPLRLRIVALLDHSLFQSELLIADEAFRRHFPSRGGHRFFLVEAPAERAVAVAEALEARLARFGLDARPAADRLAGYDAVRAMYLTTFQALGGLGLLLGTLGLGVVLARNVLERRSELAALRAFGWRRSTLAWMVAAENAFLLAVGLAIGAAAGLSAVAPHLVSGGAGLPWGSLLATLAAVAATGMLASAAAVAGALRVPLLPALKME